MSVHAPILRNLLIHPRRVAMIDDRGEHTGARILWAAMHMASEIERRCSSETVGLLLPTGAGTPMAALGGWMLGKTVVPLNYLLKPDELQYVIDDCGADTILTAGAMLDHLGYEPRVKSLVRLEDLDYRRVPELRWPASAADDDLAVLLYTSGTSGRPKGVMLTHANLSTNVRQCVEHVGFNRRDVLLGVLPQFHSFGLTVLTILPLMVGCRVVYSARFVPQKILGLVRKHRPTAFVAIPSMYNALLSVKDHRPDDFASLRLAVSGGEPLPDDVFERFRERFGVTISEGYGLTETAPVTNVCLPDEWRRGSVGRALPGLEQRIADMDTGRLLPAGAEGEVLMRGPNVMAGYFRLPDETGGAFDERGYFRTGDIGRIDREGHLSITGRLKEMLIVGGENVFPREIEEALTTHPSVHACGVVGLMDPVRGEVPVAFVELEEGASFDEAALRAHCRERLAGYKVPREIRLLDELPRNPTGKVMRRELKAMIEREKPEE